jgi:Ca2+-binding RTX toxin-like protein
MGHDTALGGNGHDTLLEEYVVVVVVDPCVWDWGDDLLDGGAGADELRGGCGDDTLQRGDDLDTLDGSQGADTIEGD